MQIDSWELKDHYDSVMLYNDPCGIHVFPKGHIRRGPNFFYEYKKGEDYD